MPPRRNPGRWRRSPGGRSPVNSNEQALDWRSGSRNPPKTKARNIAPVERDRPVKDVHRHALGVGRTDDAVKLVSHDQSGLVLGRVNLEARRRLGEPDQLDLSDIRRQVFGRHGRAAGAGGELDLIERACRALAVRELLTVHGDLDLIGAEAKRQPVPAGSAREPLNGQRRAIGRFHRQAFLGPAQNHAE